MPSQPQRDKPEQLKMFMSQREIMDKYQPLDADVHETDDPRAGEWTNRAENTQGYPNDLISTHDRTTPFLQHAPASATFYRPFYGVPESHEQMMDRKLDESKLSRSEYSDVHRGGSDTAHTPGWEDVVDRSSAPQYPGTGHTDTHDYEMDAYIGRKQSEHWNRQEGSLFGDLQHAMRPGGEGFTGLVHLATGQFGMAGKPQIAGAHHRLAAMGEIDPDRLLPVVHHEDMRSARWGTSAKLYPYT